MPEEQQKKEEVKIKLNLDKLFTNSTPNGFQSKPIMGSSDDQTVGSSVSQNTSKLDSNSAAPPFSQSTENISSQQKEPEVKLKIKAVKESEDKNNAILEQNKPLKPSIGLVIEEKAKTQTEKENFSDDPSVNPKKLEVIGGTEDKKLSDTVKLKKSDLMEKKELEEQKYRNNTINGAGDVNTSGK